MLRRESTFCEKKDHSMLGKRHSSGIAISFPSINFHLCARMTLSASLIRLQTGLQVRYNFTFAMDPIISTDTKLSKASLLQAMPTIDQCLMLSYIRQAMTPLKTLAQTRVAAMSRRLPGFLSLHHPSWNA
jgi:hypothetical protein